ncbi:MAG: glycosyltransferase [Treponema sp.]|nr:glycosyltransferase [Treponema sp.]
MINPKVSVILPVYNVENYLHQCMESLIKQSMQEIEIIAVNDESQDKSLEILEEYAKKDSRIMIINQKNGGAGKARNTGMDAAKGEYLSFLDPDDFFEYSMLEKAYNKAKMNNLDIVIYKCDFYNEENNSYTHNKWTLKMEHLPPYEPFSHRQFTLNIFGVFVGWSWDKLFKYNFIKENNIRFQEQRTSNDLYFVFSAIALAKRIAVIPEILIHQRRDSKESLSKTREKSWDNFYRALLELRVKLQKNGIFDELEKDFISYSLHACLWNYRTLNGVSRELLMESLKRDWFKNLGINNQPKDYFLDINNNNDYILYKNIISEV